MVSESLIRWLASGERGISSNAMVTHLTGIDAMQGWSRQSHPHDPDDLARCRALIASVPEIKMRFAEMVNCSPVWAALVPEWDNLCAMMDAEAPNWPAFGSRAPATYKRMRELIEGARSKF